jgi:predicted CoA-binding protein
MPFHHLCNMKKTVVVGASPNPDRYSYKAVQALVEHGHPTIAIGLKEGTVSGVPIARQPEDTSDIDTVTLYVGPENQLNWKDTILQMQPRRVIFNPGTENPSFEQMLENEGIEVEKACTLVLLATNQF